jgi:hypothetical protein
LKSARRFDVRAASDRLSDATSAASGARALLRGDGMRRRRAPGAGPPTSTAL